VKRTAGPVLALLVSAGLLACQAPSAARAAGAGLQEHRLQSGGTERSYLVYRPASVSKAAALVVALHGGWGSGETMAEQSGFNALADRHGFIVAYPDGIGRSWNAGSCCAGAQKQNVDDVGFIRALIAAVKQTYPVDGERVFGTGFSNGAMMVHRIACEAPELFAAIAPVSGGIMVERCQTSKPVPALLIQGRQDPRIPWEGGEFEGNFRPSMASIVDTLARRNGCDDGDTALREEAGIRCLQRSGCSSAPVQWCELTEVGHQWPGGKTYLPRLLGANTERFDASTGIWLFFSRLP
jgi:polyhydroxybutyrate depolymerase